MFPFTRMVRGRAPIIDAPAVAIYLWWSTMPRIPAAELAFVAVRSGGDRLCHAREPVPLRKNPELKWRLSRLKRVGRLAGQSRRLLDRAAERVKVGGSPVGDHLLDRRRGERSSRRLISWLPIPSLSGSKKVTRYSLVGRDVGEVRDGFWRLVSRSRSRRVYCPGDAEMSMSEREVAISNVDCFGCITSKSGSETVDTSRFADLG